MFGLDEFMEIESVIGDLPGDETAPAVSAG